MGSFIRQNFLPIILACAGLGLILFGTLQVTLGQKKDKVQFQPAQSASALSSQKTVVDIEGAVMKPGVYTLSSESRFVDALAVAGGLSDEADRVYVEKNINLAKTVSDGLKIYIPRVGEEILSASNASAGTSSTININTATSSDLDSLPGIGSVTAEKIISGRPYVEIDDLVKRKIVSQSVFDKIKDQISAN